MFLLLLLSQEHSSIIRSLEFDDFQIISGSRDDSILIWDFLDPIPPGFVQSDQSKAKKALHNAHFSSASTK